MNISDILILRLFVLRIGKKNANPLYRIFYGVVSPSDEVMEKPSVSEFNKLKKYCDKWFFVSTVKMAGEKTRILRVYQELLHGISLKEAFAHIGVDTSCFDFDVYYQQSYVEVPWNVDKISSQIIYSMMACMMEPARLFELDGRIPIYASEGLSDLDNWLQENTHLPFGKDYDHVGNLEVLLTQSRDACGKLLINCSLVDNRMGLQVLVNKELLHGVSRVVVNARMLSDDKVFCDTISSKDTILGSDLKIDIPSNIPIDSVFTKVWLGDGATSWLVYDSALAIVKQISITMAVIGQKIKASTDWLERLKNNLPDNKKSIANKAETIEHGAEKTHIVGDRKKCWTDRDRTFKQILKTKDMFFPKGWNSESNEIGKLSFLEWFKEQCKGCSTVFLQDPYFEDVALYFLASITTSPEIVVLTQTRLKTNSDNTSSFVPIDEEGERKKKILNYLKSYPTLFGRMNLKIIDVPVGSAILHDRYMFFYRENGSVDAFALSNSLQGATNKQPLLVTQIGGLAWERLNEYISEQLKQYKTEIIYDSKQKEKSLPVDKKIADKGFYLWLKRMCKDADQIDYNRVLEDILYGNTLEKIATVGYCLATTSHEYEFVKRIVEIFKNDRRLIDLLKDYILVHHYEDYPIGFIGCRMGYANRDLSELLIKEQDELLTFSSWYAVNNCWEEMFGNGVWGQFFACNILIKISGRDALDVLRQLRPTLKSIKTDISIEPVAKVSNLLLHEIFQYVLLPDGECLLQLMLADHEDWMRGLGMLALVSKEDESLTRKCIGVLNEDEQIILCQFALMSNSPKCKLWYYQKLVSLLSSCSKEKCFDRFKQIMMAPTGIDTKCDYAEKVISPLLSKAIFDRDEVGRLVFDQLFDGAVCKGSHNINQVSFAKIYSIIGGDTKQLVDKSRFLLKKYLIAKNKYVVHSSESLYDYSHALLNLKFVLTSVRQGYSEKWNISLPEIQSVINDIDQRLSNLGMIE